MVEVTPEGLQAQVGANIQEQISYQLAETLAPELIRVLPPEVLEHVDVAEVLKTVDVTNLVQVAPIVNTMLAGQQAVVNSDPVDTIRVLEENGVNMATATRVMDPVSGRTFWKVTQRNGETYEDTQPTLPWRVVYMPEVAQP